LPYQISEIMRYNRIKEVLASKGIKQTWLAEKLGKTYRTVNMYASNDVQPPIPVLYEIAEILQVEPKDLLVDKPQTKEDKQECP
jgi:hypothetical protein